MPFGLCNAPATFERLMERVMRGLVGKCVLIYLDDIIVYAPTVMGQFRLMEEVFNRLKTAGLKLNPSKCQLFCQETTFLGHVVSKDGIYTDPRKITDLETWPRPQTVPEVRSFLGFCTYYRRFVRHLSDLASPLYNLTEKKRTFLWTEDCERAFLRLKERLTAAPILAYPLESESFIIDTDASDNGIGAVPSQMQLGEERVIGYHSMRLDRTQRRYCVTRRELLAVVKGITHFRPYLYGRRFTLRTDHTSLRWLLNFRDPEGQWARWLQRLQEYDFDIQHRPGKSHGNADGLTRRPCDCRPCVRLETPVATTDQPVPTEKVRQIIVHGMSLNSERALLSPPKSPSGVRRSNVSFRTMSETDSLWEVTPRGSMMSVMKDLSPDAKPQQWRPQEVTIQRSDSMPWSEGSCATVKSVGSSPKTNKKGRPVIDIQPVRGGKTNNSESDDSYFDDESFDTLDTLSDDSLPPKAAKVRPPPPPKRIAKGPQLHSWLQEQAGLMRQNDLAGPVAHSTPPTAWATGSRRFVNVLAAPAESDEVGENPPPPRA